MVDRLAHSICRSCFPHEIKWLLQPVRFVRHARCPGKGGSIFYVLAGICAGAVCRTGNSNLDGSGCAENTSCHSLDTASISRHRTNPGQGKEASKNVTAVPRRLREEAVTCPMIMDWFGQSATSQKEVAKGREDPVLISFEE